MVVWLWSRTAGWCSNGGKCGNSGHSKKDVGCGGLGRDVVEENGRKLGGKWGKKGKKISPSHFPEVKDLPHRSNGKNQLTALADRTMRIFATRQH